jgi:hypothetical protein
MPSRSWLRLISSLAFLNPSVLLSPSHVAIIHLTKKLPRAQRIGRRGAFQLQIADGASCRLETGATIVSHGKRADYSCSDGSWLPGHAKSSDQPWLIRRGRGAHPRFNWVAVRTAWI